MNKVHYINKNNFICNHYEIVLCGLNVYDVKYATNTKKNITCKNCIKKLKKLHNYN